MKYLIVQNQKSKRIIAVIAAEVEAELDRELGQLLMRQAKLVECIAEAETVKFDSTDALAEHLLRNDKPKKVAYAQDATDTYTKDESNIKVDPQDLNDELNQKFTFGKHKWKTVRQILTEDPSYLNWAKDNVEWFKPSEQLASMIDVNVAASKISRPAFTKHSYSPIPPVQEEDDNIDYPENDLPF